MSLGKRVTIRMFSIPRSCISRRSRPIANPPCGGIPDLNASKYVSNGVSAYPRHRRRDVVVVAVQALSTGDEFESAEQKIEAVRRTPVVRDPGAYRRDVWPWDSP